MRYTTLFALAAAAVSAQTADQEYDSALDMTVDPNSVDPALKGTPNYSTRLFFVS
jgi:hypothetical protein